jgi:putative membrane protein
MLPDNGGSVRNARNMLCGSRISTEDGRTDCVGKPHHEKIVAMGPFVIRTALTGFALWVVTLVVHGIYFVGGDTTLQRVGIILVVAVIFGVVNAVIKPVVQFLSIPLYILTLGLIHIVINALMLWITSWITHETTHWGLQVDQFWWTAIWGAIVLSIVSWGLSLIVPDTSERRT